MSVSNRNKFQITLSKFLESDSNWERLESSKASITYEETTTRKDKQYVDNYIIFVKEYNKYLKRKDNSHTNVQAFPLNIKLTKLYIVFLTSEARYFTSSVETIHMNALKRHCEINSISIDTSVQKMMTNMVGVINHMNFDSEKPVCLRHPILQVDFLRILNSAPYLRADKLQSFALFSLANDTGLRSISIRHILLEDFISLTILDDGR
jgi:hypothetical protein